jgi:hypothetical protein
MKQVIINSANKCIYPINYIYTVLSDLNSRGIIDLKGTNTPRKKKNRSNRKLEGNNGIWNKFYVDFDNYSLN